ncbi:MAG TPA: hypothetical protein VMW54_09575 [Terriglobia bacterium]|nr:hypothetical protein [Terriglobia bacterium]
MKRIFLLVAMLTGLAVAFGAGANQRGMVNGLLVKDGHTVFPIGIYEMPKTDVELRTMAKAGINLVMCRNKEDLDRANAAGMMGWVPLPLQQADQEKIRQMVEADKDSPALAVWEGPDELVWAFTAGSSLYKMGIHKAPGEWWVQAPEAVNYAREQAHKLIPQMIKNIRLVRSLDNSHRPVWMNEAARSDMKFIRDYIDHVDIIGCDIYPIHAGKHPMYPPSSIADFTNRYLSIGENRPVWMVLQGFAWGDLPGMTEQAAYPSFFETRLMAYAAIANGAKGVLYWGTHYLPSNSTGAEFRDSIYAMTSELAKLEPFLAAPEETSVHVKLTESKGRMRVGQRGVHWLARRSGSDWLIVLVNEDKHSHFGVEVEGLAGLNGRRLEQLYGNENDTVRQGEFITRLLPQEVKVFSTSRKWASAWQKGRAFTDGQKSGM